MVLLVSRDTISVDGAKACSRCGGPRDRPGQRYCRKCHTEYCRQRRAGMVEVLLTPEERAAVRDARTLQPAGKHAAGSAPATRGTCTACLRRGDLGPDGRCADRAACEQVQPAMFS